MKQKQWLWSIAVLILVSFACNYPGASTVATPTEDLITGVARTVSAQMTQAAAAQLTQQPTAAASTAVLSTLPATITLAPCSRMRLQQRPFPRRAIGRSLSRKRSPMTAPSWRARGL